MHYVDSQQLASSEVSLQLVNPSHSCPALIQEFPREQWNWVELQRSTKHKRCISILSKYFAH